MKGQGCLTSQIEQSPNLHLFDFDKYPPSVANLSPALTINGTTVYPSFRYKGGDAGTSTWNPWGYGEALTLQAGTAPTYKNGSPLLGKDDDSVLFNNGGYYKAGENTTGNITTEDFVVEFVLKFASADSIYLLYKRLESGQYPGYYLYKGSAGFSWYMRTVGGAFSTLHSGTDLTDNAWYHLMIFGDRSGSIAFYVNGVAQTSTSISSYAASLSCAMPLNIGADGSGGGAYQSNISYCSMWLRDSWLDTHLQPTIAAERFYRLTGLYPHQAKGTATPTTYTRALAAYSDKTEVDGTTKLYYVGSGWPRSCSRIDANGKLVKGLLVEGSVVNQCKYSETFGSWTNLFCSTAATSVVAPNGRTLTTVTLHEDTTPNQIHCVTQDINITNTLTFSVYAKKANRTWFALTLAADAIAVSFDLANGRIGTTVGTANSSIAHCGNEWYRCSITAAHTSGQAASIYILEADNDGLFTGLNQDSIYIFGAQVEIGSYPSSYIPTTTAAVTRPADVLTYSATSNIGTTQGIVSCNVLCPNFDNTAGPVVFEAHDGTDNKYIALMANSAGHDYMTFNIYNSSTQASIASSTDLYSNTLVNYKCAYQANAAQVFVNNINEGTPDTSLTLPTGLTSINIGSWRTAGYELNGLINNLKFSPGPSRIVHQPTPTSTTFHAFDFDKYPPSVANLPASLTINGTTVYPTFRYKGGDAGASTWNPWGYGQALTLQAGTAPTYNNGSPLLGKDDDSVLFNGGGYYQAANNTFANISTEDFVLEIVFKMPTATYKGIASKFPGSGAGWVLWKTSANNLELYLDDTGGGGTVSADETVADGTICHVIFFADRSGSVMCYVNGVAGTAYNISAIANITMATPFQIGTYSTFYDTSNVYYLAMWQGASWLDTHLQPTIAAERFYRLTGLYPHQAKGTAAPTAYTRALAGYLDKTEVDGTTKLYYVGSGWPRSCSRIDANGKLVKGLLVEGSVQNGILQSQTFNTTWTKYECTITSDAIVAPDGTLTADAIVESAANDQHYIRQTKDMGSVGQNVCYSVYVKAGTRNYIYMYCRAWSDGSIMWTLSTGAGQDNGKGQAYGAINCGNGWWRLWTSRAVAVDDSWEWDIRLGNGPTTGDYSFQGVLGNVGAYIWGAQVEIGSYPSSYIPTTTAAVTRPADALRYNGNNVTASKGSLSYNLLLPSYDLATSCVAVSLNNAGSSTANIESGINASGDASELKIVNSTTQADITGTTDIVANTQKKICHTWQTNDAKVYVADAAEGTPDTSCSIPTGIDRIDLSDYNGANQINGLINNLKILSTAVKS